MAKLFRNYSSRIARALSTIRAETSRAREVEEMFMMRKMPSNYPGISGNTGSGLPCLKNSSEETMFGSNKIKEQHETMKLQNEEVKFS